MHIEGDDEIGMERCGRGWPEKQLAKQWTRSGEAGKLCFFSFCVNHGTK
jgi:hypothetical protein